MVERASDAQQHLLTGEAARNGVARDNVQALERPTLGGGFEERSTASLGCSGSERASAAVTLMGRLV